MANTISRQTITEEAAQKLIAAARKKAEEIKRRMVIAICDDSGHLKSGLDRQRCSLILGQSAKELPTS